MIYYQQIDFRRQIEDMRIKNGILMRTALACTMAAALLLSVSGCGQEAPTPAPETESAEQETVDLTDERTVTDVSAYRTRLDTAFADVAPVPESDVTYTVTDAGTAAVTGYTGDKTVVVIPGTLGGRTVTAVAEGAFVGSPVEALSLPDTVTDVAFGALAKCSSLSVLRTPVIACADKPWFGALFGSTSYEINRANVPNSLTSLIVTAAPDAVPDYCFYGCSALEAVSFAGLKRVGAFAFYGCDKLTCVTLPEGLETVGQYAFGNCLALAQLALPASVVRMERSMLEGCGALTALTIPFVGETADGENGWLAYLFGAVDHTFSEGYMPASLVRVTVLTGTTLPRNAFYECSRIREVILPETMTAVGDRAFYRCAYLSGIALPSVTTLGDEAFSGCVRLCDVDLSHVTTIGVQAFRGCISLPRTY